MKRFPLASCLLTLVLLAPSGASRAQFPVTIGHAHPNMGWDAAVVVQWLDFLQANDYHTVTADQFHDWLVNNEPMPIRPILLTFDDNYIRMYTDLYPALQARGQTAVNFAHTNYVGVGGANDHADWIEIEEMETDGAVLTESHTLNHVNLTGLTPVALHAEVWDSKAAIETSLTDKTCNHIAYPYGAYNPAVIAECQTAGYTLGYSTINGFNFHDTPLFEIRRIGIDGATLEGFKSRIGFNSLPPVPPGDGWAIDNTDVNFFCDPAAWTASTTGTGYYHTDYRTRTPGDGSERALWAAYLPRGGTYNLHAIWPADSGNASNATFRIQHATGSTDVPVDLRAQGGQWNLLGTFTFSTSAAARVELLDGGDGLLVADGVWFEPRTSAVDGWLLY